MFAINNIPLNDKPKISGAGNPGWYVWGARVDASVKEFTVNGAAMSAKAHTSKTSGSHGYIVTGKVEVDGAKCQVNLYVTEIGSGKDSKSKPNGKSVVSGNITVIPAK